ncbi:Protein SYS1-like protein [Diplonema papillatum]|nr:Protein SYS1-like protein [Diplonema papillatum]
MRSGRAGRAQNRGIPLGRLGFDAAYCVSQIVTLQAGFYVVLGAAVLMTGQLGLGAGGSALTMQKLFVSGPHEHDRAEVITAHVVAAVGMSYAIASVVERTSRCLDHVATLYLLHFAAICIRSPSFPSHPFPYLLLLGLSALTYTVSWRLCCWKELMEVPLAPRER